MSLFKSTPERIIKIVISDEWAGVYINGVCVYQSAELYPEDLLDILKIPYTIEHPNKWRGMLPDYYNELGAYAVRSEDNVNAG